MDVLATLAAAIAARHATAGHSLLVGVCGPQGSGKTTACRSLENHLRGHGLRAATLALDDLYLSKAARARLAATVHPLLATRGVPGTHDVMRGHRALDRLLAGTGRVYLPGFDKSTDDRTRARRRVTAPVDVLLFEGWCIGARPQPDADLAAPVNALEADHDADGHWRRSVNARLADDYAALFERLDALVLLKPSGFDRMLAWRQQQEAELVAATGRGMTPAQVESFIAHYERLTRWLLTDLPRRADWVIDIADDHRFTGLRT